jgi:hypothetical protein
MRTLFFISVIAFSSKFVFAQTTRLESLINQITNNQLHGTCHYFWELEMHSQPGSEIIKIGKPVTGQLLSVLTDPNKGIIVHYILTAIWVDTIRSWSSFEFFERDRSVHYSYNGLHFYERGNDWFVLRDDLSNIKKE